MKGDLKYLAQSKEALKHLTQWNICVVYKGAFLSWETQIHMSMSRDKAKQFHIYSVPGLMAHQLHLGGSEHTHLPRHPFQWSCLPRHHP